MAAKPRVHEIAAELGIDSKRTLEKLKEIGEFVKGPSSTIEPPVARKLKAAFAEEGIVSGSRRRAEERSGEEACRQACSSARSQRPGRSRSCRRPPRLMSRRVRSAPPLAPRQPNPACHAPAFRALETTPIRPVREWRGPECRVLETTLMPPAREWGAPPRRVPALVRSALLVPGVPDKPAMAHRVVARPSSNDPEAPAVQERAVLPPPDVLVVVVVVAVAVPAVAPRELSAVEAPRASPESRSGPSGKNSRCARRQASAV